MSVRARVHIARGVSIAWALLTSGCLTPFPSELADADSGSDDSVGSSRTDARQRWNRTNLGGRDGRLGRRCAEYLRRSPGRSGEGWREKRDR